MLNLQEEQINKTEEEFPEIIKLTSDFEHDSDNTNDTPQADQSEECTKNYYNSSLNAASVYNEELERIKSFSEVKPEEYKEKKVILGTKKQKFTLVLDLDRTLVYSTVGDNVEGGESDWNVDVTVRPFAFELLQEMSELYEIVVFTAAEPDYANSVIDILDPGRRIIAKVLTRNSCITTKEGYLVKDLRIFSDRKLSEMLIIDDTIVSFAFQLENGIPIMPFEGKNSEDEELRYLINYLNQIYKEAKDDLRKVNGEKVWGVGK